MRHKIPQDPYLRVIQGLNRRGVRYTVVGMSGINFYAESTKDTFSTLDYDIFLEPSLTNVKKAIGVLKDSDFSLGTADGALEMNDLKKTVREQRTLIATTVDGLMVELLLRISGFPYSELARDAATFDMEGVPVRVGTLRKLLDSKRLAGRPKDLQFLRRYQNLLKEK